MSTLPRLFRAERLKWRRNWVVVVALLGPVVLAVNLFMVLWFSESLVRRYRPGFAFWIELTYLAWNLILLPILVALICDLSWEQELEAHAWTHLLAQPVPRRSHFSVKVASHLILVLLSQVVLIVLLIPGGFILRSHLTWRMGDFPPHTLLIFSGYSILASLPLVTFHTWLSARFPGLGIALFSALCGSWISVKLAGSVKAAVVLPWGLTGRTLTFFDRWHRHVPWESIPIAWAAAMVILWLGLRDFQRDREPKHGE